MNNTRRGFIGLLLASPAIGIAALFKSKPEYKDTPAEEAYAKTYAEKIKESQKWKDKGISFVPPSPKNANALTITEGSFSFANRKVKIMTDENGNDILVLEKDNASN